MDKKQDHHNNNFPPIFCVNCESLQKNLIIFITKVSKCTIYKSSTTCLCTITIGINLQTLYETEVDDYIHITLDYIALQ